MLSVIFFLIKLKIRILYTFVQVFVQILKQEYELSCHLKVKPLYNEHPWDPKL